MSACSEPKAARSVLAKSHQMMHSTNLSSSAVATLKTFPFLRISRAIPPSCPPKPQHQEARQRTQEDSTNKAASSNSATSTTTEPTAATTSGTTTATTSKVLK